MASSREAETLTLAGREVAISNPDKLLFPKPKYTKLDLARYYIAVADGALRGAGGRPNMLVRYPDGIEGEHFYQKRAPKSRPPWIDVVTLRFPSGNVAEEVVPRDVGGARLAREPRLSGAASASGACRRSRSSRRAARRSRSRAGSDVEAGSGSHRSGARRASGLQPRRMAEDVRFTRHAHRRADRTALGLRRSATRGRCARA